MSFGLLDLPNCVLSFCHISQFSDYQIDICVNSWYSLTHTSHFTVLNYCPATTPNHFAAIHLRQNPLVPCGAAFFISRENLQLEPLICNSSYPNLENHMSRLDLDTAPRPRTKCGRAGQRRCNTGAGTQIRCKRRPQA